MASPRGRETTSLIAGLLAEGERFEFFQAVRLLQRCALQAPRAADEELPLVGGDAPPQREPVRFRANVSATFPTGSVHSISAPAPHSEKIVADGQEPPPPAPAEMVVNFLGLTGPNGVLPHPFTMLLIEQHRANDLRLQSFQDVFNHRLVSLFYRAWEKYRFPVIYERRRELEQPVLDDPVPRVVLALAGMGTAGLTGRSAFDDEFFLYFAGHFAHQPRNVDGIERLLRFYFATNAQIDCFVGQWLELPANARVNLTPGTALSHNRPQLGVNITVGREVWTIQTRFAVTLGPLPLREYERLLPGTQGLMAAGQMIRTYAGPELDFEVRLVLRKEDVQPCRMGIGSGAARLGWTSVLVTGPAREDLMGARFEFREMDVPPEYRRAAG